MKVVIAFDSFKGSLTSYEAGKAAEEGIKRVFPEAEVFVKPLSDGGEGMMDAIAEGSGGRKVYVVVRGPQNHLIKTAYAVIGDTAILEMASAAGLTLMQHKDPLHASTYGVGEMIRDAVDRGIRKFIIGIGGSATNDCGIGMLKALGWKFYDAQGLDTGEGAQALFGIRQIIEPDPERKAMLAECRFQIACDVQNPLCGPNGAVYVYGPQKGISEEMKEPLDQAVSHFADLTAFCSGKDFREKPGAGAAGGLGFAFVSFLHAQLISGTELILKMTGIKDDLKGADFAITGEGRLDAQTIMGKAPIGFARLAKQQGVRVLAFAGSVSKDASVCNREGIDAFFPILREVTSLEDAENKKTALNNLSDSVEQVFRLLKA